MIKIVNLTKKFKKNIALNNINMNIKGIYGLLGPNGAGKTTLMRIIATLIKEDNGEIKYKNLEWNNSEEIRKIIGYLPQSFSMYKSISIYDCLEHIAFLKGIKNKKEIKLIIEKLLIKLNLEEVKDKKIKELSGGMLRRVGIAQALIADPKIIIIDEPTAGLDIEERIRFRDLLREIGENKIIIISTHIVEDIEYTCDNICILKKGQVLAEGSREEIVKVANNKIWEIDLEKDTDKDKIEYLKSKTSIISIKNIAENKNTFRFFSNKKIELGEREVIPNLEDSYLYLMEEYKCEKI